MGRRILFAIHAMEGLAAHRQQIDTVLSRMEEMLRAPAEGALLDNDATNKDSRGKAMLLIPVNTHSGENIITLEVAACSTAGDVKDLIQRIVVMRKEMQPLTIRDDELHDEDCLAASGLKNGTPITQMAKKRAVLASKQKVSKQNVRRCATGNR